MGKTKNEAKYEFDLKTIQRAILPLVVLELLLENKDNGLAAPLIRKKAELKLEDIVAEFNPDRFEVYPSILYPMLTHMMEKEWITQADDSSYLITKEGKKMISSWKNTFKALVGAIL